MTDLHLATRQQLKSFVERIERLEEEKAALADDIRDVYNEAKSTGFDVKVMRQVIRLRKQNADERKEMEAVLETYLSALGMKNVQQHEVELTRYALEQMKKDPNIHIYGSTSIDNRGGVISFNYGAIHPHDIGTLLDQEGIAIRAGHHCCQPLMRDLGISGTARASFYVYTSQEDIDAMLKALKQAATVFAGVSS